MPGSPTAPGRLEARSSASSRVAFHVNNRVGVRDFVIFEAQWLAYALPCRRFAAILTDIAARLGANADCYTFIAADFHRLLLADFYRSTEF